MPENLDPLEVGQALPSHLTQAQVSRYLEVTPQAVAARLASGSLPSEKVLGTVMIPSVALLPSFAEAPPAIHAMPPDAVVNAAWDAVRQLAEDPDRPVFTARQLLGVYLGLARLPFPPSVK